MRHFPFNSLDYKDGKEKDNRKERFNNNVSYEKDITAVPES